MEALVDFGEDGEDIIDQLVDQAVEGVVGALAQQFLAFLFDVLAALEDSDQGFEGCRCAR